MGATGVPASASWYSVTDCEGIGQVGTGGAEGTSVTVACADFDESATLVAVTVTLCCAEMLDGAVYRPLVKVPAPLSDHVTV